ncbi:hypothetical protein TEQG_04867 [Trichophyton equinum CBS 127.97]|uniref:Uncharacterized protein n=1 Tax=Trichophyton equinum (strain ATCC MYA-4606 / CBS 127.97) TaxID=559882 RepID=F2PVD9_TRIEC|nr:hypothetical protein TEQG_04867 [Trichophyton equinum CBS 127.97]
MRGRGDRKGGRYKRDTRPDIGGAGGGFFREAGERGKEGKRGGSEGEGDAQREDSARRLGKRSSWKDRGDGEDDGIWDMGRNILLWRDSGVFFWAGRSTGLGGKGGEMLARFLYGNYGVDSRMRIHSTRCCGSAKAAMAAIGEQELAMETGSRTRLVHAGAASTLFRLQSLEG